MIGDVVMCSNHKAKEFIIGFSMLSVISVVGISIPFLLYRNMYSYENQIRDVFLTICFYGIYETICIMLLKFYKKKYNFKNFNSICSVITNILFVIIAACSLNDYFLGGCVACIVVFYYVPISVTICFAYTISKVLKLKSH